MWGKWMSDVNLLLAYVREGISACNFIFLTSGVSCCRNVFHLVNNYFEYERCIEGDTSRLPVVVEKELMLPYEKLVD